MAGRDYKKASMIALDTIEEWCPNYSDGRIDSKNECWFLSPFRPDHEATSLSINRDTGFWKDFANPDDCGDALTLYSRVKGITLSEAHDDLIQEFGDRYSEEYANFDISWLTKSIGEPQLPFNARKWLYSDGNCSFYIARVDKPDGSKEVRPWMLVDGTWKQGKPKRPLEGFPLLNLPMVVAADTVVICEGEKKLDAIPEGYVSTTWSGGASAVGLTNYKPLRGKTVILWPDNDDPGIKAMNDLQEILKKYDCTIKIVQLDPDWPKGHDAGDLPKEVVLEKLDCAKEVYKPVKLFPLVRYGDCYIKPPSWIIKGLLEDNILGVIFGASGSGKSYFALDIMASVASGTPFHGRAIKKPGAVVYIAGEGFSGISKRLKAWEIKRGISLKDAPIYTSKRACALCDPEFMIHVQQAVREAGEQHGSVCLIVIDTWARNMAGDENNTKDTNDAIRAVDDLRHIYDCSALILHHTGQAETERARGSSALKGALDVEFIVSKKDAILSINNTKMKDGTPPDPMTFGFEYVDLGMVDDDGEPVQSSVLEEVDLSSIMPPNRSQKGKVQQMIISFLNQNGPTNEVDLAYEIEKTETHDSYYRAKKSLSSSGLVTITDGIVAINHDK